MIIMMMLLTNVTPRWDSFGVTFEWPWSMCVCFLVLCASVYLNNASVSHNIVPITMLTPASYPLDIQHIGRAYYFVCDGRVQQ